MYSAKVVITETMHNRDIVTTNHYCRYGLFIGSVPIKKRHFR